MADGTRLMGSMLPRDKRVQMRIPAPLIDAVDAEAAALNVTRTQFVETALLDRLSALGWDLQ